MQFNLNSLLVCAGLFLSGLASAQETWLQHLKVTTNSMSFDKEGQQFLGAGFEAIWFSSNAELWTARLVRGTHKDVIRGNGLYVAVGGAAEGRKLVTTSSNGIVWDATLFPGTGFFNGVVYALNKFWIVGEGGEVWRSPTGNNWEQVESDVFGASNFLSISFLNDLLLITGSTGKLLASTDGITWKEFPLPTTATVTAVAYGDGFYFASTTGGEIYSSTDGKNWTKRANLNFSVVRLLYGGGIFVATGEFESLAASRDGFQWDVFVQEVYLDSGNNIEPGAIMKSLAFGKGTFVSGTDLGGTYLKPPIPYQNIRNTGQSEPWQFLSSAWGDGYYVSVGENLAYSEWDGELAWFAEDFLVPEENALKFRYSDICFGDGAFYTAAYDGFYKQQVIEGELVFTDLISLADYWRPKEDKDGKRPEDILFIPVRAVAAGGGYVVGLFELDGVGGYGVWNAATMSSDRNSPIVFVPPTVKLEDTDGWSIGSFGYIWNDIAYGKSKSGEDIFVSVGRGGNVYVFAASNGFVPTDRLGGSGNGIGGIGGGVPGTVSDLVGIVYDDSFGFMAVSQTGVISQTYDAIFWRSLAIPEMAGEVPASISYGNKSLVVVCQSGAIFTTKDTDLTDNGQKWVKRASPVDKGAGATEDRILMGLSFGDGKFAAIGNNVAVSSNNELLPPIINAPSSANGALTVPFDYNFKIKGKYDSVKLGGEVPPGLSLDTENLAIVGIPTKVGTFNSKIIAANKAGATTTLITITITDIPLPTLTGRSTVTGQAQTPFLYTFQSTGPITSMRLGGEVPAGLALDGNSIVGTPTESGIFQTKIIANNDAGQAVLEVQITIDAFPVPVLTGGSVAIGALEKQFLYSFEVEGEDTVELRGEIPPGLKLKGSEIVGTPTKVGVYATKIVAKNKGGTSTLPVSITILEVPLPVLQGDPNADGLQFQAFTYRFSASGKDFTLSLTGAPKGLRLSGESIVGIPEVAGVFNAVITATNAGGSSTLAVTISIAEFFPPTIEGVPTAEGRETKDFVYKFTTTGRQVSLSLEKQIPPGLALEGKSIRGIPTQAGEYNVVIVATNPAGTAKLPVTITIVDKDAPRVAPKITSPRVAVAGFGLPFKYTIRTDVQADSTNVIGTLPKGLSFNPSTNSIVGTAAEFGRFKVKLIATNVAGSGEKDLVIKAADITLPTITNVDPSKSSVMTDAFQFRISGVANDNIEPISVEYRVKVGTAAYGDYKTVKLSTKVEKSKDFHFVVKLPEIATYQVEFRAIDGAGNKSQARAIRIESTRVDPL